MPDRLAQVVGGVLSLPADQVDDTVGRATTGAWTSLRHLQVMAAVEDAYGVALSPREIRRVASVGELRALLRDKGCPE